MIGWEARLRARQESALQAILPRIAPEHRATYEAEKRRLHDAAVRKEREARLTGWLPGWDEGVDTRPET